MENEQCKRILQDKAVNTDDTLLPWCIKARYKTRTSPAGASKSLHTSSSTTSVKHVNSLIDSQNATEESSIVISGRERDTEALMPHRKEETRPLLCLASSITSETDDISLDWSKEVQIDYPNEETMHYSAVKDDLLMFNLNVQSNQEIVWLAFMTSVVRRMRSPDSGLALKPRKWLKMNIPASAIGDDVVNWLFRSYAFKTRTYAKNFAYSLVLNGYLTHFTSKLQKFYCNGYYYIENIVLF